MILLMVLSEISMSYSSRIWLSISFVVIPLAYMEMIFSSMSCVTVFWYFLTIWGSNSPFPVPGDMSISMSP